MVDVPREVDVLIVGSGLARASVARRVLSCHPAARVLMVEAGRSLTAIQGMNVRNLPPQRRVALDAELRRWSDEPGRRSRPGTRFLLPRSMAQQMPAAKFSSNVGGMGAHWTCAVPPPAADERPASVQPGPFEGALTVAAEYLSARVGVYQASELGLVVRQQVTDVVGALPDRPVQEMPLACKRTADGPWWTGADTVLGAYADDPRFLIVDRTVCRRLIQRGDRVIAVEIVDAASNRATTVETGGVVVAADAFRTPQLLWASGIRLPALGRYLNEHHQIVATVVPPAAGDRPLRPHTRDIDERADLTAVLWVPFSPARPYQGQVMIYEPATARAQVGLAWYAPQEPDPSNAVWFDDDHRDSFGMPAPRVRFALSPLELARACSAWSLVGTLAARIGVDAPHGGVTLLPPGSSLHYLGTVRMGARDDGKSVCDANGRVWGMANLFVAGNGVIPGPTACNPTLTAAALAVLCSDELLFVVNGVRQRTSTDEVAAATDPWWISGDSGHGRGRATTS